MTDRRESRVAGTGDHARRWHARIAALADERTRGSGTNLDELAADLEVKPKTLWNWRAGKSVATFDNMQRIAEVLDYPLEAQLEDRGLIGPRQDWADIRGLPSPSRLLEELRHLVDAAEHNRPDILDLVRAVLTPTDPKLRDPGRWRARVFDIPGGVRYPHTMFRAAEFELGLAAGGDQHPTWGRAFWEKFDPTVAPEDWVSEKIADVIAGNTVFDTFGSQPPLQPTLAWQRVELCFLLGEASALARMRWYGDGGSLYRRLFRNALRPDGGHVLVVAAYNERRPDPKNTQHRVEWLKPRRGLLLIAPTAALGNHVANLVGEALAWRASTIGEVVLRTSGRIVGYGHRQRRYRYAHAYAHLAQRGLSGEVVVVNELDTIIDEDGGLSTEFTALLDHPDTAPIVVHPASTTLRLWEQRQQDQVGLTRSGSGKVPRRVSAANTSSAVEAAIHRVVDYLDHSEKPRWALFTQHEDNPIPWWPAADKDGLRPFVVPEIGDTVVRTANALLYFLHQEKLPTLAVRFPGDAPAADRSLLARFSRDLAKDRAVKATLHLGRHVRDTE